ncbi:MAG: cysteine peptidase family C39 domain-containing protein [bacterium]
MRNFLEYLEFSSQIKDWSCGPAVVQMILSASGVDEKESDLIRDMGANPKRGTNPGKMVSFLRERGFSCESNENSTLKDISSALEDSHVVILYFLKDWSVDHYALVKSMNEDKIVLFDPWYGRNHDYGLDHFEKIWHGDPKFGNVNKWMMRVKK